MFRLRRQRVPRRHTKFNYTRRCCSGLDEALFLISHVYFKDAIAYIHAFGTQLVVLFSRKDVSDFTASQACKEGISVFITAAPSAIKQLLMELRENRVLDDLRSTCGRVSREDTIEIEYDTGSFAFVIIVSAKVKPGNRPKSKTRGYY